MAEADPRIKKIVDALTKEVKVVRTYGDRGNLSPMSIGKGGEKTQERKA